MTTPGSPFYDDPDAVHSYLEHRHAAIASPNLVMEEPAVLELIGPVDDQRVLDLGCGDGNFGEHCRDAGCRSYLGVDASAPMIELARARTDDPRLRFELADISDVHVEPGSIDLVVARMSLHYLADLTPVLDRVRRALSEQGRIVFSVVHPVVTASRLPPPDGPRGAVVVDDYFRPGERDRQWFDRPVTWQHRTIEGYLASLRDAGLCLAELRECAPVRPAFDGDDAEFERRERVPLFLAVKATR